METVTIPKKEYEKLKKEAQIDWEVVAKFRRAMEDVKHGRIREWKPEEVKK